MKGLPALCVVSVLCSCKAEMKASCICINSQFMAMLHIVMSRFIILCSYPYLAFGITMSDPGGCHVTPELGRDKIILDY